jgi:ribosomal protein S18 acetylase RimI-like enzyme
MPTQPTVIPIDRNQFKPAAEMMARAFHTDPLFTWMLPNETRRRKTLSWFLECMLDLGFRLGQVHTTPALDGAAIWLGPDNPHISWWESIRSGLSIFPLRVGLSHIRNYFVIDQSFGEIHHQTVSGPHWYLCILAVDPSRQGTGVGQALLQYHLARVDQDQLPCYLETNNERNLAFYQKVGFSVSGQETPIPGGPTVWGMLRQPHKL